MTRYLKVMLFVLFSLIFTTTPTVSAAEKKDLDKAVELIRQAATDSAKPSFFLSYMGIDYTLYIHLKDGEPELVEVVAKSYYGTKEEHKTYTIKDDDLDGTVDYATYKQGDKLKETFDRRRGTSGKREKDFQILYNISIRQTLRRLEQQ